jgi:cysteinyl-tRNA synthetase
MLLGSNLFFKIKFLLLRIKNLHNNYITSYNHNHMQNKNIGKKRVSQKRQRDHIMERERKKERRWESEWGQCLGGWASEDNA